VAHGGDLTHVSTLGGTRFDLSVPRHARATVENGAA
jgi:hypothetical protein